MPCRTGGGRDWTGGFEIDADDDCGPADVDVELEEDELLETDVMIMVSFGFIEYSDKILESSRILPLYISF